MNANLKPDLRDPFPLLLSKATKLHDLATEAEDALKPFMDDIRLITKEDVRRAAHVLSKMELGA